MVHMGNSIRINRKIIKSHGIDWKNSLIKEKSLFGTLQIYQSKNFSIKNFPLGLTGKYPDFQLVLRDSDITRIKHFHFIFFI